MSHSQPADEQRPTAIQPPRDQTTDVELVVDVPQIERVETELPGGFKPAGGLADKIRPPHFHFPGHRPHER